MRLIFLSNVQKQFLPLQLVFSTFVVFGGCSDRKPATQWPGYSGLGKQAEFESPAAREFVLDRFQRSPKVPANQAERLERQVLENQHCPVDTIIEMRSYSNDVMMVEAQRGRDHASGWMLIFEKSISGWRLRCYYNLWIE